jgi:hypothetical protein
VAAATAAAAPQVVMDTARDDTIEGWVDPVVKQAAGLGGTVATASAPPPPPPTPCQRMQTCSRVHCVQACE